MPRYLLVALAMYLHAFPIGARAAEPACESSLVSVTALLECADLLSPEVRKASLELAQAKQQLRANVQWRNPEFAVNSFGGTIGGSRQSETDLMLGIPIELGGKVDARRMVGNASITQAEAALYAARAEIRKTLLTALNRLRQLHHEFTVVDESVKTFSTLLNQIGGRRMLSPEQETSEAVYRLAHSQYVLKRMELTDELGRLNTLFLVNTGKPESEVARLAPKNPPRWPATAPGEGQINSPRLKVANAGLSAAEASLAVAKSEAWPTVTIGPSLRLQNQSGVSGNLLGFNLGVPLPLFNANGAGRAAAEAGVLSSESVRDLVARGDGFTKQQLLQTYRQSLEALNTSLSHSQVEKAHSDVEKLFARGVVPSALVIEAHRGYLDLEIGRNQREQRALEALLELHEIEGSIFEVKL